MTTVKLTAGPWQIRRDAAPLYTVTRRTPEGGQEHLAYSGGKPVLYGLTEAMTAVARHGRTS